MKKLFLKTKFLRTPFFIEHLLWMLLEMKKSDLNSNKNDVFFCNKLVHDGNFYRIEISPLICSADQWTGFCMI